MCLFIVFARSNDTIDTTQQLSLLLSCILVLPKRMGYHYLIGHYDSVLDSEHDTNQKKQTCSE